MTIISPTAEAARETARAADGRFGHQEHSEPEVLMPAASDGSELSDAVAARKAAFDARVVALHEAQLALQRPALDLASAMLREGFPDAASVTVLEDGDGDFFWVSITSIADAEGNEIEADVADTYEAEMVLREIADDARWIPETIDAQYDRRRGLCTFQLTVERSADEKRVDAIRSGMPDGVHAVELSYDGSGRLELRGALDEAGQPVAIDLWGGDAAIWAELAGHASRIENPDALDDSDDGLPPFVIRRAAAH